MSEPIYIPLRTHSEYSITDGMVRLDELAEKAVEYQYPALALTDLMNTFGLVKFYKECRGAGIKPILGADVRVENLAHPEQAHRALLLVRNMQGYVRLSELLTAAYEADDRHLHLPQLRETWLEQGDNSGLICLSGAHWGEVGSQILLGHDAAAQAAAQKYAKWFPNAFYLELQRLPEKPDTHKCVSGSLKLAAALDLPVVATHPTQFLSRDDFMAHDTRVCIAGGWTLADTKRPKEFFASQYFISPEEMQQRFADIPEALANSVQIAKRCNVELVLGKNFLPDFPTPNNMPIDEYIVQLSNEGLQARLKTLFPNEAERAIRQPEYQERLDFELKTIIQMGFSGYFLIVQDFINWAKNNGCPVGPGRGSGAGSLVAYALKITDLDPIKYALLFERFLNPERVSMPDFDIDFCQANRGRVIEYVREKYGKDAVSQIVTFGTLSSKAVIRDVGRVLQLPFSLCDRLSKLVPVVQNKPLALKAALAAEPEIERIIAEEEAEELLNLALKLENLTRNLGMHAGGVLIAPGKISDFCGVYQADESSSPVSMYDKGDVEEVGLVKFDFLGLRNLTIIEMAQNFIKQTTGKIIDVNDVNVAPLDDQKAYQIFRDANTTAVFQFESTGMKKMLKEAHTTQFEELIAFVSLYRPGPMANIPDFVARMKGEAFEYLHPLLESVLLPTYGIMVYQEQVMQAAQVLAGYSLGGADLLRRAMGKKKAAEMVKQRDIFAEGAAKKGISREKADEIFDYMEKFAEYGFNKSHAAAYAYVSFQTAWLKAHYPAEFMAATMSSELDNTDQLKAFYDDAQSKLNKIKFLPPDVNESFYQFIPNANREIRYALGAIKGTGEAAVNAIVAERERGGKFTSFLDFCARVGKQHANRRVLEALIRGGAFDNIEPNRAMLLGNIDLALQHADQTASNANQGGLFDDLDGAVESVKLIELPEWSPSQKLEEEKLAIGFYLSGHPFAPYETEVRQIARTPLGRLRPTRFGNTTWVGGFVTSVRTINGKKGKFVVMQLEDTTGKQELLISGKLLEHVQQNARELLQADQVVVCECAIREDKLAGKEGELRLSVVQLMTLNEARILRVNCLHILVSPQHDVDKLATLLAPHTEIKDETQKRIPIRFYYEDEQVRGEMLPAALWRIHVNGDLLNQLTDLMGEEYVWIN
ncbi:DNA polymerase III subunit alpha [Alysiella filiformis]|nr:DNA polymerase III subunit alpha [Alysiella filiformis]QMT32404.1 DNA polymerase III subunit alpha [Alysiella filiformis]UBQ57355.1 DNA polymerase III subunit alpha [Alysiella filiformis DSM 16848]